MPRRPQIRFLMTNGLPCHPISNIVSEANISIEVGDGAARTVIDCTAASIPEVPGLTASEVSSLLELDSDTEARPLDSHVESPDDDEGCAVAYFSAGPNHRPTSLPPTCPSSTSPSGRSTPGLFSLVCGPQLRIMESQTSLS